MEKVMLVAEATVGICLIILWLLSFKSILFYYEERSSIVLAKNGGLRKVYIFALVCFFFCGIINFFAQEGFWLVGILYVISSFLYFVKAQVRDGVTNNGIIFGAGNFLWEDIEYVSWEGERFKFKPKKMLEKRMFFDVSKREVVLERAKLSEVKVLGL